MKLRNNGAPLPDKVELPAKFKKWLRTDDPFTAWFPLYKNQERFKADMHRYYKGEITSLQQQVNRAIEMRNKVARDARWKGVQLELKMSAMRRELADKDREIRTAYNKAYGEICDFLKHYDLKPL